MLLDLMHGKLDEILVDFGALAQKPIFLLFMPIGLLHGAAFGSDRAEGAARRIGSQLVRLRVGMLVNLPSPQVEKFFVAGVFQHQRFLAIADDDPVALPDFEPLHAIPLGRRPSGAVVVVSSSIWSVGQTPQSRFSCSLRAAGARSPALGSRPRPRKC